MCVPELKIPPHPSPPLHVFPNWKDYYQAKKTPFSLPSPPLPLLSGSLEHNIRIDLAPRYEAGTFTTNQGSNMKEKCSKDVNTPPPPPPPNLALKHPTSSSFNPRVA
ncbi:hypothetical protein Hdeb2414_s0015g00451901 [Helianthus debilis subsp. tardiflorus]